MSEAPANPEAEWSETRIESAMARLQEMHAQLRHLRDAVPRLIDPMLVQQNSPEDLYSTYATNVTATRSDIKDFSTLYSEDTTRELFRQAEKSRAENSEEIRGWRVTEHEDWLDLSRVEIPLNAGANATLGQDRAMDQDVTKEGLRAAMEKFTKAYPDIQGSLEEDTKSLMVPSLRYQLRTVSRLNVDRLLSHLQRLSIFM
ncbi:MAG: hypothetical protein Q9201_005054 [Fulgogasparrea decipioides]